MNLDTRLSQLERHYKRVEDSTLRMSDLFPAMPLPEEEANIKVDTNTLVDDYVEAMMACDQ